MCNYNYVDMYVYVYIYIYIIGFRKTEEKMIESHVEKWDEKK